MRKPRGRLLLVEDDPKVSRMVTRGLEEEGFSAVPVADGTSGLDALRAGPFDACILDVLLPGADGFEVLRRARAEGITTPILMLTARDGVPDRVRGLELGADDYLTKPFAFAELLARLHAILRRGGPARPARLTLRGIEIDPAGHKAMRDGAALDLTAKQFALLEFLIRHRGEVVTRSMVLEQVFGYTFDPGTNIVDVHVAHLRQKIDKPGAPSLVETVRGVGYRVDDDAD